MGNHLMCRAVRNQEPTGTNRNRQVPRGVRRYRSRVPARSDAGAGAFWRAPRRSNLTFIVVSAICPADADICPADADGFPGFGTVRRGFLRVPAGESAKARRNAGSPAEGGEASPPGGRRNRYCSNPAGTPSTWWVRRIQSGCRHIPPTPCRNFGFGIVVSLFRAPDFKISGSGALGFQYFRLRSVAISIFPA